MTRPRAAATGRPIAQALGDPTAAATGDPLVVEQRIAAALTHHRCVATELPLRERRMTDE